MAILIVNTMNDNKDVIWLELQLGGLFDVRDNAALMNGWKRWLGGCACARACVCTCRPIVGWRECEDSFLAFPLSLSSLSLPPLSLPLSLLPLSPPSLSPLSLFLYIYLSPSLSHYPLFSPSLFRSVSSCYLSLSLSFALSISLSFALSLLFLSLSFSLSFSLFHPVFTPPSLPLSPISILYISLFSSNLYLFSRLIHLRDRYVCRDCGCCWVSGVRSRDCS